MSAAGQLRTARVAGGVGLGLCVLLSAAIFLDVDVTVRIRRDRLPVPTDQIPEPSSSHLITVLVGPHSTQDDTFLPTTDDPMTLSTPSSVAPTTTNAPTTSTKVITSSTAATTRVPTTSEATTTSGPLPRYSPVTHFEDRVIECGPVEGNFTHNEDRSKSYLGVIEKFARLMLRTGMPAFIFDGTLLGFRRECGIVAHTSDIDFAADGAYLTKEWVQLMKKLTYPHMNRQYGIMEKGDGIELNFLFGGTRVDLFFLHRMEGREWGFYSPGFSGSTFIHWEYPLNHSLPICRTNFQGLDLMVPCEPEEILEVVYGPHWEEPIDSGWSWVAGPANTHKIPSGRSGLSQTFESQTADEAADESLIQAYRSSQNLGALPEFLPDVSWAFLSQTTPGNDSEK